MYHQGSRVMGRRRGLFFAGVTIIIVMAFFPYLSSAASPSCDYFSDDFSGGSANQWMSDDSSNWSFQNGWLIVGPLGLGDMTYAGTAFSPSDYFVLDVDIPGATPGSFPLELPAFGIYPFTTKPDVSVSVNDRSLDGVGAIVWADGTASFIGWDLVAGEYYIYGAAPLPQTLTSVGVAYSGTEITLRLNKQNASLKVTGTFPPSVLPDTLWLFAEGLGTQVAFDNLCAGPLSTPLVKHTLTVNKTGAGSGTITSSPSGINCGSSCAASYTRGSTVILTASADAGSSFGGWSGGGCSGTGTCPVTLNANAAVSASFIKSTSLPAPGNLRYTRNGNMMTISWDAVAGAAGYKGGLGMKSGSYDGFADVGNITTTGPFDVSGVPAGTYYIVMKAYNGTQESGLSNEIAVTITDDSISSTIGSAGGSITLGGVTLTVPQGAFPAPAEIVMKPSSADGLLAPSSLAGDPVDISGIPENFSKPLAISIKHNGDLSGDLYIALGTEGLGKSSGTRTVYNFLKAYEEGGYLKGVIPSLSPGDIKANNVQANGARASAAGVSPVTIKIKSIGVKNTRTTTCSGGLFTVIEPIGVRSTSNTCPEPVCYYLDNIYNQYRNDFGFVDVREKRTARNIQGAAQVQLLGDPNATTAGDAGGYAVSSFTYWDDGHKGSLYYDAIETNASDYYRSCDAFRETLAHEALHMVQQSYEPINYQDALWIDEASATFAEELLMNDPASYVPINAGESPTGGNNRAYSLSLLPYQSNLARHGYGISPFVKYLVGLYGKKWLYSSFVNIDTGKYSTLLEDFLNPLNKPINNLWEGYIEQYLRGNVYGISAAGFVKLKADGGTLQETRSAGQDTFAVTYSFKDAYQALSAKIYDFPIVRDSSVQSDPPICFKVSDGLLMIYEVPSSGALKPISSGWNTNAQVGGLASFAARGSHLLAVVNNSAAQSPFNQAKDITLSTDSCATTPPAPGVPPSITSGRLCKLSPGQQVTIKGSGFGAAQGSSNLSFSCGSDTVLPDGAVIKGTARGVAVVVQWSENEITIVVPDACPTGGQGTGQFWVDVDGKSSNSLIYCIKGWGGNCAMIDCS